MVDQWSDSFIFGNRSGSGKELPYLPITPKSEVFELVSGVVKDETGVPLQGASVIEKGITKGTITDLDGKFSIDVDANAILQISFL